jgi:hypothetical protein
VQQLATKCIAVGLLVAELESSGSYVAHQHCASMDGFYISSTHRHQLGTLCSDCQRSIDAASQCPCQCAVYKMSYADGMTDARRSIDQTVQAFSSLNSQHLCI